MKIKILLIILLLLIPLTTAISEDIVKTTIQVSYDNNTRILRIIGENLDWSKTINSSFNENFEIIMIRHFGNMSELTNLMETCRENFNFSQKWQDCIALNSRLDIAMRDMINTSQYDLCVNNNTQIVNNCELSKLGIENSKNDEVKKLTDELNKANSQKGWWTIIAVVFVVISLIVVYKYRGFGRRETFEERDKSVQASF